MSNTKFFLIALGLFTGIALSNACSNNDSAREKVEETGEDIADVFRSEQEELAADIAEMRRDVENQIEQLQTELERASGTAQSEIQTKIDQLNAWKADLDRTQEQLGEAMKDNWQQVKTDVQQRLEEIERDLEERTEG